MLEILAIIYFSKKIREICEEKNIVATKWIIRLIAIWFGIEILIVIIGIFLFGENAMLLVGLVALMAGIASGFYNLNAVKDLESKADEIEDLGKNEKDLDYFR